MIRKAILFATTAVVASCAVPAEAKRCPNGVVIKGQHCPTPTPNPTPAPVPVTSPPTFSVSDATVNESAGTVSVTVTKSGSNGLSSSLSYTTADGTAVAGNDYAAASGTLAFADATTTQTITVTLHNDSTYEPTETFGIKIQVASNGTVTRNGTVTILDDDPLPLPPAAPPTFTASDAMVSESAGSIVIHVQKGGTDGSSSTVTYATVAGTATSGLDYTSTSGTLTFADADTDKTVTIPIISDTEHESDETFTLQLTATVNGTITRSPLVTIMDDDAAVTGSPTAATILPTVASDSIPGATPIASEFDYNLSLQSMSGTGAIPPSAVPDNVGAFRFVCGAGQLLRDDPIVFPGQPGASHLHQFYGNNSANGNSTFASLRAAGTSTCNNGTYASNRSAYWMPAMLDGKGKVVQPDYVTVYYKRRPVTDPVVSNPANAQFEGYAVPIPNGLRFVFGWDPTGINSAPTGSGFFDCTGPTANAGPYSTITQVAANCPAGQGNRMGFRIEAPGCWDGKNLDSADHRSHVGYPSYGSWGYLKCDSAHPYVIPTFTIGAWYSVKAGDDLTLWQFSSDAMAPGKPHGYTMHSDYFEAWDNTVKAMWTGADIDKLLNASGGDLGNGKQVIGAGQPSYGWVNPNHLVPVP